MPSNPENSSIFLYRRSLLGRILQVHLRSEKMFGGMNIVGNKHGVLHVFWRETMP